MQNVVVIGGGAAGLMAAITAAEGGNNVTVFEKMERPCRKVMITGKGRCNVTNNSGIDTHIANATKNGKFLFSALSGFTPQNTMEFFENNGVALKTERGNRVFPVSDKSVDIVDALVKKTKKNGVKIINMAVKQILTGNNKVTGVLLNNNQTFSSDSVVLATGGKSYPLTGSTGDGYIMAEELGHTVTELKPSLVPIKIHEGFCSALSGLSLKNVTLSVFDGVKKKPVFSALGEMLFTHFGISGPLTLSASAHMRKKPVNEYKLVIDLKPALTPEQLDARILRDFSENNGKNISNSLNKLLPKSLIPVIIKASGILPETKVNQITKSKRQSLVQTLKNLTLTPIAFRDIDEAIITSGGVKVSEINPATMESKLISGLYFAGEIIDVDSYTGGFNLQIAFSTGALAGRSIV
ncbi:MAG: NAD(P)/FAD-dependent oxidoreductase [Clostridia bacterium]|nr:NAD(P)/FAD-dependent oxidoreductase [Clostridia bacterium]